MPISFKQIRLHDEEPTISTTKISNAEDVPSYRSESKMQLFIALPVTFNMLAYRAPWIMSIMFVGRIGETPLAAASMASTLANVTGLSVLVGLSSALATLGSQAFGAKDYDSVDWPPPAIATVGGVPAPISAVEDSCTVQLTTFTSCPGCFQEFTFLKRQHHCQHCGMGFCSGCIFSTSTKAMAESGIDLGFGHLLLCECCKELHMHRLHTKLRLPSGVRLSTELENGFLKMIQSNLKIDYLDAMNQFKEHLENIALPKSDVKLKQAEKDAVRESFMVNGKSVEQDFWQTENEIAENIMSISSMTRQQAQACAMKVFCITNRTCSGAESFFVMTQLFHTPNIIIKCRAAPAPTMIDVSKGKNRVIVKTEMSFPYGLYKKNEVDEARKQPRVWLRVDAVVRGEIRFSTWKSNKQIDKKGDEKTRATGAGLSGVSTISQKHLTLSCAETITELHEMHDDADEVF